MTMRTAIYGIGNTLLGDDGAGPATVHLLEREWKFAEHVVVEDLGTPSLDLPGYMSGFDLVVFVDAVAVAAPPGTIRVFTRDEIVAATTGIHLSPHELSINDALVVLDFAGTAPRDVILIGVVPATLDGGMELSEDVAAAIPRVAERVVAELERRGVAAALTWGAGVLRPGEPASRPLPSSIPLAGPLLR